MGECYSKRVRLFNPDAVVQGDIDLSLLGEPRAIIDNRYSKITDDEAASQIEESMRHLSGIGEFDFPQTMLIRKDGSVDVLGK